MTLSTCPHCGAERHIKYDDIYECGTGNRSIYDTRTILCHRRDAEAHAFKAYEEKIAAQAAEIDRLTERNKILEETVRIACEEYPVEVNEPASGAGSVPHP
jgi:hypothetical protein